MRVLVTGGAGFIGSHVVDRLHAHGYTPRIFDLHPSPFHGPETEFRTGDILDLGRLRGALRGCDAVVHLAAVSDVNEVLADPAKAELVNASGTEKLLEGARLEGVNRVLYASTIWVYGGAEGEPPLDEDSVLAAPTHLYTATKLAGELYCGAYNELYGMEHTILRFGIPYGPRARPSTVVATFVGRALAGKALSINGTGDQSRQFVYVEDLAEGVVRALRPTAVGRVYNLVGEERVAIREIAATVRDLVGDVPIVHVPERTGDLKSLEISGRRASEELDWQTRTDFRSGVLRYIESVSVESESPREATASSTAGSAASVVRQESREL